MGSAVRSPADNQVAKPLKQADHRQNDNDRCKGDIHLVALMAVADGEIPKAASPDYSRHGGQTDQADDRNRRRPNDSGDALPQVDPENNLPRAGAH